MMPYSADLVTSPFIGNVSEMRSKLSYANIILILASLLGAAAFLSPFFGEPPQQTGMSATAHGSDAMLVLILLSLMALAAIVAGLQSDEINAKTLSVLGALAAVGAIMRFIPGPGGRVDKIALAGFLDAEGHYTQWVYRLAGARGQE